MRHYSKFVERNGKCTFTTKHISAIGSHCVGRSKRRMLHISGDDAQTQVARHLANGRVFFLEMYFRWEIAFVERKNVKTSKKTKFDFVTVWGGGGKSKTWGEFPP